ncbi:MAG: aminopeptidase [Alphaproteobacteria bacterium]|nr:aminopeptidase [Alphaproteobacteria bacterium]
MHKDERIVQLAENIIKNSVCLKKGEQIYIEAIGVSTLPFMQELVKVSTVVGGVPFYYFNDQSLQKEFIENASIVQLKALAEVHKQLMSTSKAYVGVRGNDDLFLLSSVSADKMNAYMKYYWNPVHSEIRVPKTKWCVMRYPNAAFAAMSKMPLEEFENFYFDACLVDYAKMSKAMKPLKKLMDKTKKVRIIAPNTDLEFSIAGLKAVICDGKLNVPDGEVYTAPVKDSINGVVQFNTDTSYLGTVYSNISLVFKNGKIIEGHSQVNDEKFQKILNIDEGARYMGEFALGVNNQITRPMLDILFDEKIGGSFHMAIGNSYEDETNNGNKSAIHWDLVQMQDVEHGGGEIWFDDVLIRKDGKFVLKELADLN